MKSLAFLIVFAFAALCVPQGNQALSLPTITQPTKIAHGCGIPPDPWDDGTCPGSIFCYARS
jgi:hypothetical protein